MTNEAVVGIDLSLTSTGIAVFRDGAITTHRVQTKPKPTGIDRKGKPAQTYTDKLTRFRGISDLIMSYVPDVSEVYLEGPSYGSPQGVFDLAGNWWTLYGRLCAAACTVHVVPPSNVKMYAVGKGGGKGADKDNILAAVIKRYPDIDITGNDVADAVVLMALGCRMQGRPLEAALPQAHLNALKALQAA